MGWRRLSTTAALLALLVAVVACSPASLMRPAQRAGAHNGTPAPSARGAPFCTIGAGDNVRPGDGGAACGVTLGVQLAGLDCTHLIVLPPNFVAESEQESGGASRPAPVRFGDGACTISTSIAGVVTRIRPKLPMPADIVVIADFTSDLLPPTVVSVTVRCEISDCVGVFTEVSHSAVSESVARVQRTLFSTSDGRPQAGVPNRLVVSASGDATRFWLNGHAYGPFKTGALKPAYVTFDVDNRDGSLLAQASLLRLLVFATA